MCLLVALTHDRLVIAVQPPFNFVSNPHLNHDIPLQNLIEVTETNGWLGPRVNLWFKDSGGHERRFQLMLKDQRRFMDAVRSVRPARTPAEFQRLSEEDYQASAMLPLGTALRTHWLNLVALGVYPTFAFIGLELFGPQAGFVLVPSFFIVGFLGLLPVIRRRAPFAFWIMAMAIWCAGAFPAMVLGQLVRWLRAH